MTASAGQDAITVGCCTGNNAGGHQISEAELRQLIHEIAAKMN